MPLLKEQSIKIYLRLLGYLKPYWAAFSLSMLGFILFAGTQTAFAALMEYLVDEAGKRDSYGYIWIPLAIIVIFLVRGIGAFLGNYLITYVARHIVHDLRMTLFSALQRMPSSYFATHSSGHLLAKVTYNVEQVTLAATDALRTVVREGITVIGLMAYLVYLNPLLSLIFVGTSPFIAIVVAYAAKRFRKLSKSLQGSVGDVTHVASEAINGYQVIRAFGAIKSEHDRFARASNHNRQQSMKLAVAEALNSPVVQLIVASALALLVFLALHPALGGDMSSGEFVAFITAAGMIAKPLRQLTEVNAQIQKGVVAAHSVFEVEDHPKEPDNGRLAVDRVAGALTFDRVSFRYDKGERVLSELSFSVAPGQTVALVGKSGSGKSTLASLLPRFYEVTDGEIRLDDHPLQDYALANLRQQIALVNQQLVLFDGTIRQNIAYGALADSSDAQVLAAAEAAHVMEFARKMEHGLDTVIGEQGVMLSGGQRQRIAIARAILKDAPILILDEATSALDNTSERHIQAALEAVMKGRTTLVIAHRLSTIENADCIMVMEQGRVVEQGRHAELLARNGAYARLYQQQFEDLPESGEEQCS